MGKQGKLRLPLLFFRWYDFVERLIAYGVVGREVAGGAVTLRSAVVGILILALLPAVGNAQAVRGTAIDGGTSAPLPGVVVLLIDSAGSTVARALTGERGEYRLAAAVAGTYRVRTLRIGFRSSMSDAIVLAVGQDVSQPMLLAGVPVSLATVRVVGRSACRVRPDSAAATFSVWEQIGTALAAAELTAATRELSATIVQYQRSLDPAGRRVLRQQSSLRSGTTARPWRSVSLDSLRRSGYAVTEEDETTTYFAPDLDVLLSEAFLADHCFRLVSDDDRLGLAFEPTLARRNIPGIRGTLWLDRASSELRRLEFRYVNLPREQEAFAGGEIDFLRLAQGGWLISRWSIRVPVIETRRVAARGSQRLGRIVGRSVREIRVDGGELALVTLRRDTLWARPPLTLAGTVRDSASAEGISAARVELRETGLAARTDAMGRFRIPGVLPGEYTLDVTTPLLDAIGVSHHVPLAFTDGANEFAVHLPSADQMARSLCEPAADGVVAGSVSVQGDSAPPRDVTKVKVVVEWNAFGVTSQGFLVKPEGIDAYPDARGHFRICGVPRNTALTVRVEAAVGAARPLATRIPLDRHLATVEISLDPEAERAASLSGVILSDANVEPISGAEVVLPALARSVHTNERGEFRLSDIPAGMHQLLVRRLGYRQRELAIEFESNQTVERRLLLTRVVTLDTVAITASVVLPEFERNRRLGIGRFLTRAELQKHEQLKLPDVLAQLSGVRVMRGTSGGYVASRRAMGSSLHCDRLSFEGRTPTPRCACYAQVYLDNALLYSGALGETVPDLNSISVYSVEAIEYYAGPSQTPIQYARLNSQCGVLVIHTRRSP